MAEEKELPVEKDDRLYVPGLAEPLERDGIRHIHIEASDLRVKRSFSTIDGKTFDRMFVVGKAWLENCTIGIAGEEEKSRELSFHCKPCDPDEPDGEWLIQFGHVEGSWEIGTEDEWFVECYIPRPIFGEFANTHRAGNADGIRVSCTSNMWADSWVRYAPIVDKIDWKIPAAKYGSGLGVGRIDNFHWEILPKKVTRKEDHPAYQMGRAFANDTIQTALAETKTPPTEKPISKWWWFAGGIALVVWWLGKSS